MEIEFTTHQLILYHKTLIQHVTSVITRQPLLTMIHEYYNEQVRLLKFYGMGGTALHVGQKLNTKTT